MTLADADNLEKNDPKRFEEYYYFVVEKLKAEQKANQKAIDIASGKSTESDTFRFKDRPKDHVSIIEE